MTKHQSGEPVDSMEQEKQSVETADEQVTGGGPQEAAAQDEPAKKPKKAKKSSLKDQVAQLEADLAEQHDKYLRQRAEFDNFRKRMQREIIEARNFAKIGTLEEILPVLDHFQMAMAHTNDNADFATLKAGMDMILAEFERCFANLGVEKIPTVGETFDPNLHEAISTEPSEDAPEGQILREWKAGYRIGERILRAPAVVVSSGPAADEEVETLNDEA